MYFGVFLINAKRNILVPMKWIFQLNVNHIVNNGLNSTEEYLIFYSKDLSKGANFLAPIGDRFTQEDACYYGKIFKVFGKSIYLEIFLLFLLFSSHYFQKSIMKLSAILFRGVVIYHRFAIAIWQSGYCHMKLKIRLKANLMIIYQI